MGVQSARFFAESISKPLHLTNCHLYMRSGMDHAFPIFPCFDKVIKPVLGSFPRFCPQLSFEQGCGVPPNYELNKSTYSNGLDLRNKYAHSTYPEDEKIQEMDYMILLKIMILVVTKINEEFCLREQSITTN